MGSYMLKRAYKMLTNMILPLWTRLRLMVGLQAWNDTPYE